MSDALKEGTKKLFEYHCWESPESSDAVVWYRSHQEVEVLRTVNEEDVSPTLEERNEEAAPLVYRVRFVDGFEYDVFEDELLDSASEYTRSDPPKERSKQDA